MRRVSSIRVVLGVLTVLCVCLLTSAGPVAQTTLAGPRVELQTAPLMVLPGLADSNSPLLWERMSGVWRLFVMTSVNGRPHLAAGPSVGRLGRAVDIAIEPWPGGGVWMEAVVQDAGGTWYGYFHNEVPTPACPGSVRQTPRIGAARSRDRGRTWETLGIVLEAPPSQADCTTSNAYFDGGVGDLSVQLDAASQDLYIFYSSYPRLGFRQGVGVARMAWADRDAPSGRAMVWRGRTWLPAATQVRDGQVEYEYPLPTPVFFTREPFHDDDLVVDEFWGPSVHWNTYLQRYVMLLNRAKDENFGQEGTYVSFATSLSNPRQWSTPVKVAEGGLWYPQVVGLETGVGTDKVAGEYARYFQGGTSNHLIRFIR